MKDESKFYKLLSLITSFGSMNDNTYSDMLLFYDEKLMSYQVSLVMDIDELLDRGYSKEEIINIIISCNFMENDPELSEKEAEYLRKEALRLLDIRYKLYLEEKNKKTKKYLFNK